MLNSWTAILPLLLIFIFCHIFLLFFIENLILGGLFSIGHYFASIRFYVAIILDVALVYD